MIKRVVIASAATLLVAACSEDQPESSGGEAPKAEKAAPAVIAQSVDKAAMTADAKAAVMELGKTLKTQLQAAIKTGGAASAVEVCHDIAPAMAGSLSEKHGMTLTRVSLKNRNPEMGVPSDWQATVLNDFEARQAAGEAPTELAYSAVVDGEYRFMKAIPTGAVCLNCHGSDLKPEVQQRLSAYYPEDRAVGYEEGQIRGAFVAVKPVAAPGS